MSLGPAFRAGYRTLIARPTAVLPLYVAALALPALAQTVALVGVGLAIGSAAGSGALDSLHSELESAAPISIDDPASVGVDATALEEALLEALTPTVSAILVATVLLGLAVFLVASALLGAGQFHAVYAAVTGRSPTREAVDGVFQHWRTFLALWLLEILVYLGLLVLLALLSALSPVLGVLAVLPALAVAVVVRLAFAFARPAAVVDDVGVAPAVRGGYRHVAARRLESLGYGLFVLVALATAAVVGWTFSSLGAGTVSSLVTGLFVFPLLDLVKTILYADGRDASLAVPSVPPTSSVARSRQTFESGVRALGAFARGHAGELLASTALFAAGLGLGLVLGGRVDHIFVASIEQRLGGVGPLGSFFEYAANNWSVAAAQVFAGFAVGVPTVVVLLFNGTVIGALYQFETAPEVLLAFVVPHGLIEIPALLVSGALGLHLGTVAVRYAVGTVDRGRLVEEIDSAFRVVVGLALAFVAAAAIEAFVSPYYWRLLGI